MVLVAALALLGAACSDDEKADNGSKDTTQQDDTDSGDNGDDTGAAADRGNVDGELVIGTLVPQTGDLNVIAKSLSTPIDIAVEEINEAGGVLGKEVKVVPGDDGTDADVARNTYNKLVNSDKVDVILGPAPSGVAGKMVDTFSTDKVPACSGSTTAGDLSGVGNGYFFRTAPPDRLQAPALATLITEDGHSNVGILARNDDYGSGFATFLQEALEEAGAEVAATSLYDPNGSNFDADVQKIADAKPDAVAIIGFNDDGARVVVSMIGKNIGPAEMPIYTADGMQSSSFGETVDPTNPGIVAGMKGTAPASAPAGIEHPFLEKFAATGIDTIFSSYFYDCAMLMALAVEAAQSDAGPDISAAFAKNLAGDEDCSGFADCRDLLAEGKTIHYRGASSNFDRWDEMEPGTGAYDVWEYDDSAEVVTEEGRQIEI